MYSIHNAFPIMWTCRLVVTCTDQHATPNPMHYYDNICMLSKINAVLALKIIINLGKSWGLNKSYLKWKISPKFMGGAGPHQPKGKNQRSLEKPMSWQLWLYSRLIQQDSMSPGYTVSRHHNRGCLWACKNPCPAVMKPRWASTSLQMRDEFQGCNKHNAQSHLKKAYPMYMYLISYTIL